MRLGAFFLFVSMIIGQTHQAVWVTRFTLQDQAKVDALIRFADEQKLTDVFIQVRGRGDAFYQSQAESNLINPTMTDKRFRTLISKLKQKNIRVHAWINVFLLASSWKHVQRQANHILNAHPNWIDHHDNYSSYKHDLRNTADLKNNPDIEGIYSLPIFEGLFKRYESIVSELVDTYNVDGIHLDYFRLSQSRAGFHPKMRRLYAEKTGQQIEQTNLDYAHRVQWMNFISSQFTRFLQRLRSTRASVQWSVAVKPNPDQAKFEYGQDWATWLDLNIVNFVVPMNYSSVDATYKSNVSIYQKRFPKHKVWVGLATFNQPIRTFQKRLKILTQNDVNYSIFSFDNLFEKQALKLRK